MSDPLVKKCVRQTEIWGCYREDSKGEQEVEQDILFVSKLIQNHTLNNIFLVSILLFK